MTRPQFLGVDPSQRHTGLCLYEQGAESIFFEIKPQAQDLITSTDELRQNLRRARVSLGVDTSRLVCSMEKQLSAGAHTAALMFHVQMVVLEELRDWMLPRDLVLVMPLPIQLKSYMKKVHEVDTKNATSIVQSFRKIHGFEGRISQHCVDAWFLVRMAEDVLAGRWTYKLPSKERPLFPWRTVNGEGDQPTQ